MISDAIRVPVAWVRERLQGPDPALLICAYDDEEKCRSMHLPGSIQLAELKQRLASLQKDRDLVFYCG